MTAADHDWENNSELYPSKRIALANKKDKQDSSQPTMRNNISNGVVNTTTPNLNTTQGNRVSYWSARTAIYSC